MTDITAKTALAVVIQDVINGKMRNEDYSDGLWKNIMLHQKEFQTYLKNLGNFVALTFVEHSNEDNQRSYHYRIEFKKAILLQNFVFDDNNKVSYLQSEDDLVITHSGSNK